MLSPKGKKSDARDESKREGQSQEQSSSDAGSSLAKVDIGSLDETAADNETLDSSAMDDTSTTTGGILNWLSKSPQYILKTFKKEKTRVRCSSEIDNNVVQNISGFQKLSPIQRDEMVKKGKLPEYISLSHLVDRIDYASLADDHVIPTFLTSRTCYDLMPTSGKVVVLSQELVVKNAFEALVNNELRAAPLWSTALSSFVGMLTISDFINVLRHYYRNAPENIKDIESQAIATWKKITKAQKWINVNAVDNLALSTKIMIEEGVHRIPVVDELRHCVTFVLTKKRLLHYIYYNIIEKFGKSIPKTPLFLNQSIRDLGVGTFEDIATVTYKTSVIEALDMFMERGVSALPIVDENNAVLDIFAKFDVFALAKEQSYHNLDMTIEEAIEKGKAFVKVHEDVYGCGLDDSLGNVINTIVSSKAHRVVVIDDKKVPIGMVSLSDILRFLVVQPLVLMKVPANTIEETPEGATGGGGADDNVFLDVQSKEEEGECPHPSVEKEEKEEESKEAEEEEKGE